MPLAKVMGKPKLHFATRDVVEKHFRIRNSLYLQPIVDDAVEDLKKTLEGTFPRGEREIMGETGFSDAFVHREINVNHLKGEVFLSMYNNSGSPHKIWHELNNGMSRRYFSKTRRVKVRKNIRTSEDLTSQKFDGYKEEWFTAVEGREMKSALRPRNWYLTILNKIRAKYGIDARLAH